MRYTNFLNTYPKIARVIWKKKMNKDKKSIFQKLFPYGYAADFKIIISSSIPLVSALFFVNFVIYPMYNSFSLTTDLEQLQPGLPDHDELRLLWPHRSHWVFRGRASHHVYKYSRLLDHSWPLHRRRNPLPSGLYFFCFFWVTNYWIYIILVIFSYLAEWIRKRWAWYSRREYSSHCSPAFQFRAYSLTASIWCVYSFTSKRSFSEILKHFCFWMIFLNHKLNIFF